MILGLGVDYVRVSRMGSLLDRFPERAPARLFTEKECRRCDGRPDPAECYAARFAAKEAFLKALGTGLAGGISWREMEIRLEERGRPRLAVSGRARRALASRGGTRVHLSFSHDGGAAVAVVVIEGRNPSNPAAPRPARSPSPPRP